MPLVRVEPRATSSVRRTWHPLWTDIYRMPSSTARGGRCVTLINLCTCWAGCFEGILPGCSATHNTCKKEHRRIEKHRCFSPTRFFDPPKIEVRERHFGSVGAIYHFRSATIAYVEASRCGDDCRPAFGRFRA